MTEEQYQLRLDAVLALMRVEPEPGSIFARLMDELINEVMEYEKEQSHQPIDYTGTLEQSSNR